MEAGFTLTKQGWHLLAKLLAGDKLEISKIMVGSGKVPEGVNPGELTDLVQPVALATSTLPQVEDKQVSFIVEYRNDLNGGLAEGFWLNEFGVFANDPDEGEVLLYYATMGDYPQYVSAFSGGSVDIRRYPVSIAFSDCEDVQLAYPAGALVTAEEMEAALVRRGVPSGGLEGQMLVKAGVGSDSLTKWGPWPSNPNLLINSDFRNPVNRNGKTTYTNAGYTIDRWIQEGRLRAQIIDDFIRITKTELAYNPSFYQLLENSNILSNKIVTVSFLYRTNITVRLTVNPNQSSQTPSTDIPTSDDWNLFSYSFIVTGQTNNVFWFQFRNTITEENNYFDLRAVKLELGPIQTLAHQDAEGNWVLNDPPNYALQYALCSQYSPSTGEFVGSQHSNPNLLDNAYWADKVAIINQRGLNEYTNAGYTIDRWYKGLNILLSILDNSITISANEIDDSSNVLSQKVNITQPAGQIHTLSALVKGNGILRNLGGGALSFNTTDFELIQLPITALNITEIQIRLLPTQTVEVKAIKLELGPVQTLAHKEGDTWILNDPPPNKALELAKCQRYFQRYMTTDGMVAYLASGFGNSAIQHRFTFPVPTTMRSVPTVSYTGNVLVKTTSGERLVKSIHIFRLNQPGSISVLTEITGGGVVGENAMLMLKDAAIFDLVADL